MLEAAPDAMIIVDEHGRITMASSEGQSVDFLVPQRYRRVHAAQLAPVVQAIERFWLTPVNLRPSLTP